MSRKNSATTSKWAIKFIQNEEQAVLKEKCKASYCQTHHAARWGDLSSAATDVKLRSRVCTSRWMWQPQGTAAESQWHPRVQGGEPHCSAHSSVTNPQGQEQGWGHRMYGGTLLESAGELRLKFVSSVPHLSHLSPGPANPRHSPFRITGATLGTFPKVQPC